ncbi:hypothetical protein AB0J74_10085 [Asanoa sp. NPDC049573]|uniref:RCC1 domain-containing protein n=1 Tax=Asanoa sp. NPDC049573 TaxID=3155396 RepID=UPI0034418C7A
MRTAISIAAGPRHGLALLSTGNVKAWGDNSYGELGDGTTADRMVARSVAGMGDVKAVAAGSLFSLALLGDGTVRAWGRNVDGQLGDGTTTNRSLPVPVVGLPGRVSAIAAGSNFALALLANGGVMAWGSNDQGSSGWAGPTSTRIPSRSPSRYPVL